MCPVCSSLLDIAASRQGCHAALFTLRIWFSVFSLTFRQIVKSWSGFHAIPSTVYNSRNASLPECCAAFCLNFFLVCSSLFIIYYRWASLSSLSLPSFPLWTTVNLVHRWQSKNPGHSLTSPSSLAPHTDLGWKQVSGGSDQHLESAGGGGGGGCFWPGVGGGISKKSVFFSLTPLSSLLCLWCWRWFKMWHQAFPLSHWDVILFWPRMMSCVFCFGDDLGK